MNQTNQADKKYREYKHLNAPQVEAEVLEYWKERSIFKKSMDMHKDAESFVFYEGPPSANGMPGIHHVISRTIKDVFCRYKTLQGYEVKRKAGWDTHGLPIELQVEKALGITKDDIGTKISIEDYNKACRRDVLKFKDVWDELTEKIGYWVDLDHPYITYENNYIESVWNLLKRLHDQGYLYKGYTIQPYSPAAGTGLSSHELNQPGTYRDVKDTSVIAQFKLKGPESLGIDQTWGDVFALAWTTTPWTLPSNTALGVGKKIDYLVVNTFNQYTFQPVTVVVAQKLFNKYFNPDLAELELAEYNEGDKKIPYEIVKELKGADLVGMSYEQLMPYQQPEGKAFEIIGADFVTTEDGTGIVHLAPSFGADDFRAAQQHGIGALTLVDKKGKFIDGVGPLSGKYVKNYTGEDESDPNYRNVDVEIAIMLKEQNKAFKVEKYEHSYPHCWRTDKPILYYPLESWFVRTTAVKDKLIAFNKTINWKPKSTGEGRFGNWLENLVDWNLSRSRYWGTPLPIWRTEDGTEEICIGSIAELTTEIDKAVEAGVMESNPAKDNPDFDLHRPYIDDVTLVSSKGQAMTRETDLIDVWFDSGAMPYAQQHYPFENREQVEDKHQFPADFIAEGVDQTRGWFFTLHVLGVMLFDSVAYKNVVANGLVLDKNGNKMSKRLGNTVDPFETVDKYGADIVRWYMMWNSAPWDNLKFNMDGLDETRRKFFGTLYNLYGFYALYANVDSYTYSHVPVSDRAEIDQWILSKLNSLIAEVEEAMDDYEPTKAARAIQSFTTDHLSNWYVRLCRRRFWKSEDSADKLAAYASLYECLDTISVLMSSIAPFYSDRLYQDLHAPAGDGLESVHLATYPAVETALIDKRLEEKMSLAQQLTSMILAIRKKEKIKVRQPLGRILIPSLGAETNQLISEVKDIILSEVNIKEIDFIDENSEIQIVKQIKPNFKVLGPRAGKRMKLISQQLGSFDQDAISQIEKEGGVSLTLSDNSEFELSLTDVEISSQDMPGWHVESEGKLTVALDISITDELEMEGLSRELVNRIQNMRKDSGFEVTDRINVTVQTDEKLKNAVNRYNQYICGEVLADSIELSDYQEVSSGIDINGIPSNISIQKAE